MPRKRDINIIKQKTDNSRADTLVVLDFETTGLSPTQGDRAIEIGAIRIEKGIVKERFQELMNPGRRINGFIEDYTGITNAMLRDACPCEEVMNRFADFIGDNNLLAHNASFDQRFLDSELDNISRKYSGKFACSMLVARRVYQDAPNHRLSSLIHYKDIPSAGNFHRALYDSEMTVKLWLTMLEEIAERSKMPLVPFALTRKLMRTPQKAVHKLFERELRKGK